MPEFNFRHAGDFEVAAAAIYVASLQEHDAQAAGKGPWDLRDGWRLGARAPRRISLGTPDGGVATVEVFGAVGQGTARVSIDGGAQRTASLRFPAQDHAELVLGGEALVYSLAAVSTGPLRDNATPAELFLGNEGWSCRLEVLTREAQLARVLAAIEREEGAADPAVRSPMPGTVVSVSVSNGDTVEAGQVLLAVEAMKMEHQLVAPLDGTVHIIVGPGDLVKADQVLATIHPPESSRAEDTIEEAVIAMGAAE
jgi:acetyl-CoA/propionyl-CoA carboxylase biotin carboxyl carrier protein